MSRVGAAIAVIAFVACKDRAGSSPRTAARDAAVARDAAGLDAGPTKDASGARDADTSTDAKSVMAAPRSIETPLPPWPPGRGPSCPRYLAVSTVAVVSCAVCEDGAVDCWGETSSQVIGQRPARGEHDVTRIGGISDAVSIAVSVLHSCVLTRTGGVKCWGRLDNVGLQPPHGPAGQAPAAVIVEVPLAAKAVAIAVGDLHACALLATGEVACWGVNDRGQLGVDDPNHPLAPTVIPGLRAIQIAAAGSATCAVDVEHRARCWGWNGSGLLGAGDQRQRIGPVRIGRLDQVAELAMDGGQACLRRTNQEMWCWGGDELEAGTRRPARRPRIPPGHLAAVTDDVASVVGEDGRVVVANGAGAAKVVPDLPPVRAMSSRGGGSCAVLQTGELRCWGQNPRGALVLAVEAASP